MIFFIFVVFLTLNTVSSPSARGEDARKLWLAWAQHPSSVVSYDATHPILF